MNDVDYPLRDVFCGGMSWDGNLIEGAVSLGPFHRPGMLWQWANGERLLVSFRGLRDDINRLILEKSFQGWRAIKVALDEWAIRDLTDADAARGDGRGARILQGDDAWRDWDRFEEESEEDRLPPPHG